MYTRIQTSNQTIIKGNNRSQTWVDSTNSRIFNIGRTLLMTLTQFNKMYKTTLTNTVVTSINW